MTKHFATGPHQAACENDDPALDSTTVREEVTCELCCNTVGFRGNAIKINPDTLKMVTVKELFLGSLILNQGSVWEILEAQKNGTHVAYECNRIIDDASWQGAFHTRSRRRIEGSTLDSWQRLEVSGLWHGTALEEADFNSMGLEQLGFWYEAFIGRNIVKEDQLTDLDDLRSVCIDIVELVEAEKF